MTAELVTPLRANELLSILDENQRKLRPSNVRSIKLSFAQDRIVLSGDAIIIANGKLIQGQHRLRAIVESGKTIPLFVMTSTDQNLYDHIDGGLPRKFADRVSKDIPFSAVIGAAINFVRRYDQGAGGKHGLTLWGGDVLHCKSDQKEYFLKHRESLQEAVVIAKESKRILFGPSIGTAFLELAWRNPKDKIPSSTFLNTLISGLNMRDGSAVYNLRRWLEKERDSSKKCRQETLFAEMVKAWNCKQTHQTYCAPKPLRVKKVGRINAPKFPRFYWEKSSNEPPITICEKILDKK